MTTRLRTTTLLAAILATWATSALADDPIPPPLKAYLDAEAGRLAARPLLGVQTADEWKARRPEFQRRLRDMLGLDPLPPRTDVKPEVRGVVERPDFVVERLVFQSSPGLYVTGNLYRPKVVEKPLPAVLYVCGHANVEKDGVIYGNKAHYQHHAAWFAANGYVCLVLDTLQLGEVPGLHHGTYREGMWWWQSRGYTPAGVEVWNGIRALDYLTSRPEVDPERLGVTGRSGGGAISWYLGAVDDRLKVVVPVAGITDLHDHLIAGNPKVAHPAGVVDGHCDCMYFVNTDQWDHTMLAALVAPRALLVANTDVDPIFPEAGVRRIFQQLETVYGWYGAREKLDLVVGKGGHVDTPEIRHPAFAWFERWFKGDSAQSLAAIQEPDRAVPIELLKVLEPRKPLPANVNDTVHESFIPLAAAPPVPKDQAEWEALKATWRQALEARCFAGDAPNADAPVVVDRPYQSRSGGETTEIAKHGLAVTAYDYWIEAQPERKLRIWMFHEPGRATPTGGVELVVLTPEDWENYGPLIDAFEDKDGDPSTLPGFAATEFAALKARPEGSPRLALVAPTGVGRTAWPKSKDVSVRRRFGLLGQTVDGVRVLDVRRAVRCMTPSDGKPLTLVGRGEAAALALWAAAFRDDVSKLVLIDPPATVRDGPAFLNLGRILDMPQAVALLFPKDVRIVGSPAAYWEWPRTLAERLGAAKPWPEIAP
ncbi:alpha/beta hydrolase [Planctomyces sp. SH-PL62]|uniref:alpha/beta hydrolase n=1 Tax=Planctomyces sp. SH-PL62 TaxID=1636152 RepID=UPI00078DFDDC|nr:acetylxylan esterase [Planctomyces sp. SH-PL62]AMV36568.1 Alpha/beta hydrolase family protein [Planctomyces sp. SH-PL62]